MVKNKVGKALISLMSLVLIVSSLTGCAKKNEEVVKPEESKVGLFNEIKTYEDAETYESGVISVDGVVLKNAEFTNDLVISDSVGEGTIYLDNVKIKGKLIVEGGGMNSIHVDNSDINKIVSNRTGGRVRIAVSENTKVQETEVLQDTKLEVSGNIANIKLSETAKGSEVLVNATAKVATLETKAEISLTVDSAIDKLSLQAPSNVVLNAPIENLSITKEAENTAISIAKDVVITNLATEGKVDVQGEGTITNATTTDKNNITGNVKPDSTVISETPISDQENPSIIVPTATPVATAKPKPTVQPTVAPTATPEPTVAPTPAPTPAPKPVTTVTISGQVEVGETLTAVSDGNVAKTTTWYVDGVEVGTNSSKYVIDIKDYGKKIKVKVNTVISTETIAVGMPSNMVIVDGTLKESAAPKYKTINEAINVSGTDGIIHILAGTYTEEVTINKGITIKGTKEVQVIGTMQVTASSGIVNLDGFNIKMSTANATSNNGIIGITANSTVNINDMTIESGENKAPSLAVGIRLTGANAEVNITKSNIDAYYYGISLRNVGQNVSIDNCTIKGWAAVMTSKGDIGVVESNSSIIIKNSTLESVTISQGPSNEYGAIVLQEGYNKVNLSVSDSTVETGKLAGNATNAYQTVAFDIRSFGNTVGFTNCTMNAKSALNTSNAGVIRIGTDKETTTKKENIINLNNNTFIQGDNQKLIHTIRPIIFGDIDKIYINGELASDEDVYFNEVTISDAAISYQNDEEIILDFTTDKDIKLNTYSKAYGEEEIKKMYEYLLTGTNIEKQDAANKIGNDIVLAYYYLDGGEKIPLKTKGENELVKFKVWDGYLNQKKENGDYVKLPSLQEGIGYLGQTAPKGTWRTNTSPATGTVNTGWLDDARGHEVGVDIVIVYEGRISCKELKIEIPSKNVDPIISDANVKYDAISEDIIVEFKLDKGFVLNNYENLTDTQITATYTSYLMGYADANESAKKIGNDLILTYYYKDDDGKKIELETAGGNPLVKFKMWDGYLNQKTENGDYVKLPSLQGRKDYLGQTIPSEKTWTTSTNPKTGTVKEGWLNAAKGHNLYVDIIVLYEGKTIKETVEENIPLTNSVSFELNDLVSNEINTPIIQEDEESKLDVGITDTPAVLPTEEKEVDKEDETATTEDSNAVLETTPQE